jgi:transcriptional regulator with XRE-family HTH domain
MAGRMTGDRMPNDRVPNDRMPNDRVPNDRMPNDRTGGDRPNQRMTLRGADLGAALRELRTGAGLTGRAFIEAVAAAGGPPLDRAQLSRIEGGERGLPVAQWHRLLDAVTRIDAGGSPVPAELVDRLADLLPPPPELIEALPPRSLAQVLDRWYALARVMHERPAPRIAMSGAEPPTARGLAAALFMARYRGALDEILRRADLATAPAGPDPADAVQVLAVEPAETEVPPNGPFEIRVRLRNAGPVPWGDDRLLLRLGPPISSTLAQTAPLLPVPATAPGAVCDILVPGRGHYLPGRCVVSYVMLFANGRPCLAGGLSLPVTTVAESHSTLSLSEQVAAFFRNLRRR